MPLDPWGYESYPKCLMLPKRDTLATVQRKNQVEYLCLELEKAILQKDCVQLSSVGNRQVLDVPTVGQRRKEPKKRLMSTVEAATHAKKPRKTGRPRSTMTTPRQE